MRRKFNLLGEVNKTNLLASIYDGVLITDHLGRVVFANPAMENISGCLREKMVGRKAAKILAFAAKGKTPKGFLKEALEGWRGIKVDGHWKLVRGRGASIPVQIVASPIYGKGIDLAGLMVVVKNANEGPCPVPPRRKGRKA